MKYLKGLRFKFIVFMVAPVLILGVIFVIFANRAIYTVAVNQMKQTLYGVTQNVRDDFVREYSGYYWSENGRYYSGDLDISPSILMLDTYKERYKAEITIFFWDVRAVTTIVDKNNQFMIGTKQSDPTVTREVLAGRTYTSDDVLINDERYVASYIPLRQKGEVVGMVFAGISDADVSASISQYRVGIIISICVIIGMIIAVVLVVTNTYAGLLNSIKVYMSGLASESMLELNMPQKVLDRTDEIGDLGRFAVEVGNELQLIMGRDPLTGLYNRRAGRTLLDKLWDQARKEETTFSIVMCDIDHFKRVNDTYGHDMGDKVLKRLSEILQKYCGQNRGSYAIRWGGEEMVLGLYLPLGKAINMVTVMADEIRAEKFEHDGREFNITVTFGISSSKTHDNVHDIIVSADEKLYRGKEEGRDRVVF